MTPPLDLLLPIREPDSYVGGASIVGCARLPVGETTGGSIEVVVREGGGEPTVEAVAPPHVEALIASMRFYSFDGVDPDDVLFRMIS